MKTFTLLLIHLLVLLARLVGSGGMRALVAESLLLKQQLLVLRRNRHRAPNLLPIDRLVLGLSTMFISPNRIPKLAAGLRPSTLFKLHQLLVRRKYRALFSSSSRSRSKPGPKGPSQDLVELILELKRRNPSYGCPRIALIIATTFGIEINKDVVRRVLQKNAPPGSGAGGPSWLTFIGHAKDSLWSVDLFRCESILLKSHWVLVVMDQFTRRVVGFAVHAGDVDGRSLCRMFNGVIARQMLPRHLSTDNDPLFRYQQWEANLRILDIEPIKSVPYTPTSHPFVERLIGTVRREYLDQTLFWNSLDLERKLATFREYFNEYRVHSSLDGNTPAEVNDNRKRKRADVCNCRWQSHCGGLASPPIAA